MSSSAVQLVRLSPANEERLANNTQLTDALVNSDWARVAEVVHRLIGRTLVAEPESINELHWGGYVVVDEHTLEVVGSCAFKAPPTGDGTVEIAYFTYPGFEGRGYATAMATRLIALASDSNAVRRIIAHTLPETSASTAILAKVGMTLTGEVDDPGDGKVWRWQLLNRA